MRDDFVFFCSLHCHHRTDIATDCSRVNTVDFADALMLSQYRSYIHICMDCSRQILHPRYTCLQYGTAVPAQLHGYRLYHFLPDPCNSYDMSVTQNERVNEREGEEKRNGGSERPGIIGATPRARYRRIANRGIARSANNTGALSQSRRNP